MISADMAYGLLRAPRYVLFGPGTVAALGDVTREFGTRVLLCIDSRLPEAVAVAARSSLAAAGCETRETAVGDVPTPATIDAAAECDSFVPEVIVAVGGGATLDMGKLVALRLRRGALEPFYGENHVPDSGLPVVGVPTTAGTGSEVSPVSVLYDPTLGTKQVISSPRTIPVAAISDPELTVSCPPSVTAHAGLDALANAIESYTSARRAESWQPLVNSVFIGTGALSAPYALEAAGLIGRHLETAFTIGANLEARGGVALGSLMAGLAFAQSGTALVHALNYPIEAARHTPHGLGVALLLPYVMEFNRPTRTVELARLALAMGVADFGADQDEAAEAAIAHVEHLNAALGVPASLHDIGVERADLDHLADEAMAITRLVNNNGRRADAASARRILEAAWVGDRRAIGR